MVEVLYAVSGESIAVFEREDIADATVRVLRQRLAQKIGVPRFRLRLLQDDCPLDDDQTLTEDQMTRQVVQLVILEFLPPDREQDQGIMVACEENDDKLLDRLLNQPRNPNFVDESDECTMTPLCEAASKGSLNVYIYCLKQVPTKTKQRLLLEQHLFSWQLTRGTLKLSDFLSSPVPTKTKQRLLLEQRLYTLQLRMGTLKLSDFWLRWVPTKT